MIKPISVCLKSECKKQGQEINKAKQTIIKIIPNKGKYYAQKE